MDVSVALRPDLACKKTPSVLLEVQRLAITLKDQIISKLPTPSKKGKQNHHKYLSICLPRAVDSNAKKKESVEFSTILIRHFDFSISNKTDKLLNLKVGYRW